MNVDMKRFKDCPACGIIIVVVVAIAYTYPALPVCQALSY